MHHYVEKTMLVPEYVPEFQCIGPACEDHCCKGWHVSVDKKSYFSLKENKNPTIAALVTRGISRQRNSNNNDREYAKAKQDEKTGCCVMLSEDNLCHIHKELGENYLPHTCATYPRYTRKLFGIYQQSLSFSCPEAARKGLLISHPMKFIESKILAREELIEKTVTKHAEDAALANDIRFFCINLVQYREIPLWQRIAILGYFCEQSDILRKAGKTLEISQLIEGLTDSLRTDEWQQLFSSVPANLNDKVYASVHLLLSRNNRSTAHYYDKILSLVLTQLGVENNEFNIDKSVLRYQAAMELGARDFLENHQYILENLLVNDMFGNGFPVTESKPWFDGWLWLFAFYQIVTFTWIGLFASFGQRMDTETAVSAIQALVKSFQHADQNFKDSIVVSLKDSKIDSLASSLSLIKTE